MVEISAKLVMDLRQKTGAKMMDAKRALVDANGDFNKAIELLREKGQADSEKRTVRTASEGTIAAAQTPDHGAATLVELNCETDFVAKTDQFKDLASVLAAWALSQPAAAQTPETVPAELVGAIQATVAKTGENIQFKRSLKFTSANGVVESYIHAGGKIGVLVQIDGATTEAVRGLAKDLAMQVAAASPEFLTRDEVSADVQERELEIYRNLARNEGKKEEMLDRIAQGRLEKYFKENCLVEQQFVKDPDKQVKTLVAEIAKAAGVDLVVARFVRFQLGQ